MVCAGLFLNYYRVSCYLIFESLFIKYVEGEVIIWRDAYKCWREVCAMVRL
jgi:hypothetical protein